MELFPDKTVFVQIVAFIILWAVLKRLVFEPIMDALDARNGRTVAARAQAEQLLAAAEAARGEYEQSLHAHARPHGARKRARLAPQRRKKRTGALHETREAANEELRRMRADVAGSDRNGAPHAVDAGRCSGRGNGQQRHEGGSSVRRTVVAVLLQLLPVAALAAEAEHHHAPPGVPWGKLIFSFINLGIFLYLFPRLAPAILPKLGLPGSRQDLRDRQRQVVDALEKAAKAKEESERLQAEWQQRLESLDAELETMLAQAREGHRRRARPDPRRGAAPRRGDPPRRAAHRGAARCATPRRRCAPRWRSRPRHRRAPRVAAPRRGRPAALRRRVRRQGAADELVARRYAKAIIIVARSRSALEQTGDELRLLRALAADPTIAPSLANPLLAADSRRSIARHLRRAAPAPPDHAQLSLPARRSPPPRPAGRDRRPVRPHRRQGSRPGARRDHDGGRAERRSSRRP